MAKGITKEEASKMEDKMHATIKENKKATDSAINAIINRLSKLEKEVEILNKEKEEWTKEKQAKEEEQGKELEKWKEAPEAWKKEREEMQEQMAILKASLASLTPEEGLALLQWQGSSALSLYQCSAPISLIKEAAVLHPFAVAAYTGPLLDIGRNPFMFPCAWLYRQGVLTPWNRIRRPKLDGDNWWRGHAAAFLQHSKLPPEALRQGRVHQAKRECAYFVIVVHELRSVVIAVRGTETPEDLLTDGLGRESILTDSDLAGLFESVKISATVKQQLRSSRPHFAHKGIIEAARELARQLDNLSEDEKDNTGSTGLENSHVLKESGCLWKLLGPGGECESYSLQFVGHSLGGSIAALTALRFYARYPGVHAYGYGVLPCVDASVADACSDFVTSIVYNDEFSSRLSISSIKRLRIAAVSALASEPSFDFGIVTKLARRILGPQQPVSELSNNTQALTKDVTVVSSLNKHKGRPFKLKLKDKEGNNDDEKSEALLVADNIEAHRHPSTSHSMPADVVKHSTGEICCVIGSGQSNEAPFHYGSHDNTQMLYAGHSEEHNDYREMFMPGLIVHIIPNNQSSSLLSWDFLGKKVQQNCQHHAFIKDRTDFQDLVISTSMFLDHMPWRLTSESSPFRSCCADKE
ncbi:hypothetical protein L7F22_037435 [Adiantum nelumboides]|nr:hypothetical protein [Adiantum nelumboides]